MYGGDEAIDRLLLWVATQGNDQGHADALRWARPAVAQASGKGDEVFIGVALGLFAASCLGKLRNGMLSRVCLFVFPPCHLILRSSLHLSD